MNHHTDVLNKLAHARAAALDPPEAPEQRRALLAAIAAEPDEPPEPEPAARPTRRVPRPGKRTAWLAATAAAVLAAAGTGAGLASSGLLGNSGPETAKVAAPSGGATQPAHVVTAAYVLHAAATNALQGTDPDPGSGEYFHVTTHSWDAGFLGKLDHRTLPTTSPASSIPIRQERRTETWIPPRPHARMYMRKTGPIKTTFFTPAGKHYVQAHASKYDQLEQKATYYDGKRHGHVLFQIKPHEPNLVMSSQNPEGRQRTSGDDKPPLPPTWAQPSPTFLAQQPREPQKLLDALVGHGFKPGLLYNGSRADTQFDHLAAVLATGLVPADLRAALYQAALRIPGVTVTQQTTNLDGRPGIAVGRVDSTGHIRQEIIFSRAGYAFLGRRNVYVKPVPRSQFNHVRGSHDDLTIFNLEAATTQHIPTGTVIHSTAVSVNVTNKPAFAIPK